MNIPEKTLTYLRVNDDLRMKVFIPCSKFEWYIIMNDDVDANGQYNIMYL